MFAKVVSLRTHRKMKDVVYLVAIKYWPDDGRNEKWWIEAVHSHLAEANMAAIEHAHEELHPMISHKRRWDDEERVHIEVNPRYKEIYEIEVRKMKCSRHKPCKDRSQMEERQEEVEQRELEGQTRGWFNPYVRTRCQSPHL